jgi:hypothetical protein
VRRKLFFLVQILKFEAAQTVHRDAIQAVVVILLKRLGLVIVVIGATASASATTKLAIKQAIIGIESGQIVCASIDGGS